MPQMQTNHRGWRPTNLRGAYAKREEDLPWPYIRVWFSATSAEVDPTTFGYTVQPADPLRSRCDRTSMMFLQCADRRACPCWCQAKRSLRTCIQPAWAPGSILMVADAEIDPSKRRKLYKQEKSDGFTFGKRTARQEAGRNVQWQTGALCRGMVLPRSARRLLCQYPGPSARWYL